MPWFSLFSYLYDLIFFPLKSPQIIIYLKTGVNHIHYDSSSDRLGTEPAFSQYSVVEWKNTQAGGTSETYVLRKSAMLLWSLQCLTGKSIFIVLIKNPSDTQWLKGPAGSWCSSFLFRMDVPVLRLSLLWPVLQLATHLLVFTGRPAVWGCRVDGVCLCILPAQWR